MTLPRLQDILFLWPTLGSYPPLIVLLLSTSTLLPAQQVVLPPSPNAASLAEYADIPVTHHTGLPDISIPLHTVVQGELRLPVSMSYHASGLKVSELASWVGAGWSLNASGVITRTVRGAPDEGTIVGGVYSNGYYDVGGTSYLSETNDPDFVFEAEQIARGHWDSQPDIFFFNFNGYAGKFLFDDRQRAHVLPEQDIQVIPHVDASKGFYSWTLVTPDGTRYTFGLPDEPSTVPPARDIPSVETSESIPFNYTRETIADSWFLTKIESADGNDQISFTYVKEEYGFLNLATKQKVHLSNETAASSQVNTYKTITKGARLQEITFTNGSIYFEANTTREDLHNSSRDINTLTASQAKRLDVIQIRNAAGACVKKFAFDYGYFTDNTTTLSSEITTASFDRKRLRLDQVQESSCEDQTSKPPYTFDYYDSDQVPRRLSLAQDHWGLFNGATGNNTRENNFQEGWIPTYRLGNREYTGGNREPSWPHMRVGTLSKVTYPTGGATRYTYESASFTSTYTEEVETNKTIFSSSQGEDVEIPETKGYRGTLKLQYITRTNPSDPLDIEIYINGSSMPAATLGNLPTGAGAGYEVTRSIQLEKGVNNIHVKGINCAGSFTFNEPLGTTQVQKTEETTVGGLRIATITYEDKVASNPDRSIQYQYNDEATVLINRPVYVLQVKNSFWAQAYGGGYECPSNQGTLLYQVSSGSVLPLQTTHGSHIGYSWVEEVQPGNGKTVYKFRIISQYPSTGPISNSRLAITEIDKPNACQERREYPASPPVFEASNGELVEKIVYGEGDQITFREAYAYKTSNPTKTKSSQAIIASVVDVARGNDRQEALLLTRYQIPLERHYLSKKTTRTYPSDGDSDPIVQEVYFTHDSPYHTQLTKRSSLNSQGTTITEEFTYPADLRFENCQTDDNDCYEAYQSARAACHSSYVSNYEAETEQYAQSQCASLPTSGSCAFDRACCEESARQYYRRFIATQTRSDCYDAAEATYFNCLENKDLAQQLCYQQDYLAAGAEMQVLYDMQQRNQTANAIEHRVYRESSVSSSRELIGGTYTEYGRTPNGSLKLSRTYQARQISPDASFQAIHQEQNNISVDNTYEKTARYQYNKQGNVREVLGRDGVPITYLWGYHYSLPVAKLVGVTWSQVKPQVSPDSWQDLDGSDLRAALEGLRQDFSEAQVSIYTHDPLVGLTSVTDPDGRTTQYHYDDLNRLEWIESPDGHVVQKLDYRYAPFTLTAK